MSLDPKTWNGAVDRLGNVPADKLTTAQSPVLRVVGTHRPAMTFHYAPLAGGGFRIHRRAYYTDTGRPLRPGCRWPPRTRRLGTAPGPGRLYRT